MARLFTGPFLCPPCPRNGRWCVFLTSDSSPKSSQMPPRAAFLGEMGSSGRFCGMAEATVFGWFLSGAPEEIRTPDPQIRSLVLYPAELRALDSAAGNRTAAQRHSYRLG